MPPKPENESDRKLLGHVEEFGTHNLHVFDTKGKDPEFTFSIGMYHSYNHPEILIIGLKKDIAHWILNEIARCIREENSSFDEGKNYIDLIDGFDVKFFDVQRSHYKEYLGTAIWFYEGYDFPVRQLVWPSSSGHFPWEAVASKEFKEYQPILTDI